MYVISRCLLGCNCKYNGGNNEAPEVISFCRNHSYVSVCPETAGGLPSPRPPAEKTGDRIIDKEGTDMTEAFVRGAEISLSECLSAAEAEGKKIEGAILKANSPSCGAGKIYDGTFSGTLTDGYGVFASKLAQLGIEVITEKEKIKW